MSRRFTSLRARRAVLVLVLGLPLGAVAAQTAQDTAGRLQPTAGTPVFYGTDTLFRIFGTLGPFLPGARAVAIEERLRQADARLLAGDSIVVIDHDTYSELMMNDVVIMSVLDADAAPLGMPRPELARLYATRMKASVVEYDARTTPRALLVAAGFALAATIVMLLLLKLLAITFPRLQARIEAMRQVRLQTIHIQQFELLSAGRLSTLLWGIARVVRIILTLLLFYLYVPLVLSFFPWTAPLSHRIVGYAVRPFHVAWVGFVSYLPNLFFLAAGIIIIRYALSFLRLLFGAVGTRAITISGFYPEWAEPTYKIVRVLVLAFAATVLFPYLPGTSSDAFKGVSIFLGVLFSLGSSSAVGNMVAGVVLTYTRAFQIGDRVKIAETVGDVIEKTLLVTRLRTIKNVAVTIPNGTVLGSQVVNYTTLAAERGLILNTSVTIGYDAPWRTVHELLITAATRTEGVLAEPAPFVLQTGLDDFYVRYELNAYTAQPSAMAVIYSTLHQNIQETFNAGGVEIMSPHYGAHRDGNQTTIPAQHLAADYEPPSFRVRNTGA